MTGPVTPIELTNYGMPQNVIDTHQQTYIDYANKYNIWVGPLRFRYSTSSGENISVSGSPPVIYHYTSNTSLLGAAGRSIHEYTHLVQIAYGAANYNTDNGDTSEHWKFMGPRWWSEGTAQWLTRAYSLVNNVNTDVGFYDIPTKKENYKNAANTFLKPNGEKLTLRYIITPNTTLNPDWVYVDQYNIYGTHVYDGGISAIEFLMNGRRDEAAIIELLNVIKDVDSKNDWLAAFLEWSGYNTLDKFHDAFDNYIFKY
jgi:hypothetical protein